MSAAIDRLRQIAAAWHRAVHVDSSMLPVHICDLDAALADLAAERTRADAAEAQHAELAAAVRAERSARNVMNEADQDYEDGVESVEPYNAALAAWLPTDDAVAALLSAAPAPSTVSAALVRAYLATESAWREGIGVYLPGEDVTAYVARRDAERARVNELRAALDAALGRCG